MQQEEEAPRCSGFWASCEIPGGHSKFSDVGRRNLGATFSATEAVSATLGKLPCCGGSIPLMEWLIMAEENKNNRKMSGC